MRRLGRGLHSADSMPTALQTALEHVLTCIAAPDAARLGTYSAQVGPTSSDERDSDLR
jgi:hypothetical protein